MRPGAGMSVDWYDRCQSVEAELMLARADVERLKAENENLREQIELMTRIVELEFARRRRVMEEK
jgi:hypothetical protein